MTTHWYFLQRSLELEMQNATHLHTQYKAQQDTQRQALCSRHIRLMSQLQNNFKNGFYRSMGHFETVYLHHVQRFVHELESPPQHTGTGAKF